MIRGSTPGLFGPFLPEQRGSTWEEVFEGAKFDQNTVDDMSHTPLARGVSRALLDELLSFDGVGEYAVNGVQDPRSGCGLSHA